MEAQQFHLKWNNHSLNTLSSFQHLLDTNTLVDVSLTCSNGKTVTAHRMVLAACSDYFYHLFKDLPERHPVIVFKDAGEEIVRDLLLFMYKGEVEVQEIYLNDFLKFADTLQVKGLSQSDRDNSPPNTSSNNIYLPHSRHINPQNTAQDLSPSANTTSSVLPSIAKDASTKSTTNKHNSNTSSGRRSETSTPSKQDGDQAIPLIKGNNNNNTTTSNSSLILGVGGSSSCPGTPGVPQSPPTTMGAQDLAKSYLASLSKFPSLFPLSVTPTPNTTDPTTPPPPLGGLTPGGALSSADLLSHLSSPNLYRALQRKYPETNPILLKQMPFFKKMFGDNAELAAAAAAAMSIYPQQLPLGPTCGTPHLAARDDNDNDSIAERSPPTTPVPQPPPPTGISLPGLPGLSHLPPLPPGVHLPTTIPGLMRGSGLPMVGNPLNDGGENGFAADRGAASSPMDSADSPYPPSSGAGSMVGELNSASSSPTKTSKHGGGGEGENEHKKDDKGGEQGRQDNSDAAAKHVRGSKGGSAGRGSRLERMIAAEYKIMSEFSENTPNPETLPVMTPELMKSRRTHSLQLAIAEIMHNRASVQSAATKYHIPRETLRRHYQRYLKTMGIERAPGTNGPVKGSTSSTTAVAAATNNNAAKGHPALPHQHPSHPIDGTTPPPAVSMAQVVSSMAQAAAAGGNPMIPTSLIQSLTGGGGLGNPPAISIPGVTTRGGANDDSANGFSSLMEIGQAYGIWSPDVINKDHPMNMNRSAAGRDKDDEDDEDEDEEEIAKDDKHEKEDSLVIDEKSDDDEEDVEVDDDEPLSPGGPEDEQQIPTTAKSSLRLSGRNKNQQSAVEPMDDDDEHHETTISPSSSSMKSATTTSASAANNPINTSSTTSKAPMETSA